MNSILDTYGGMDRSNRYEKVEATIVSGDGFVALKGVGETLRRSAATITIDSQLRAAPDRPTSHGGRRP
jgi:hypothetical protein